MSRYPVINAGTTPAVGILNEMLPQEAFKASGTSRASTTALTADPDLAVPVEASATYDFDMDLVYNGGTNGSSDLKFAFTGPSGYAMSWGAFIVAIPAGVASVGGTQATTMASGTVGAGTMLAVRVSGTVTTSTTAGNLVLTWAQNTSSGTATTLMTGCKMSARRVK
jgi:hypothetical protein